MGLEAEEDEKGNLLVRVAPAPARRTVLLCAHLDTVDVTGPLEPVVVDGGWENAHDAILGADNKAAVAVMLEVARRVAVEGAPVGLELLFTVEEEDGLRGAQAFDAGRLTAEFGYVFDHASPIGEVIVASPTYFRIAADFHGRAAHAGPAAGGRPLARSSPPPTPSRRCRTAGSTSRRRPTSARCTAASAPPTSCRSGAGCWRRRARIDAERVEALVSEMIDAIQDGAAAAECDVDVVCDQLFEGYRQKPSQPAVVAAEAALRACGFEPQPRSPPAADRTRTCWWPRGFPCVNLANGTERNHEPTERVSVDALEGMLDVALRLLDETAAV